MEQKPIITEIDPENAPEDIKEIIKDHLAQGYILTGEKRTLLHNGPAFNAVEGGLISYPYYDDKEKIFEWFSENRWKVPKNKSSHCKLPSLMSKKMHIYLVIYY